MQEVWQGGWREGGRGERERGRRRGGGAEGGEKGGRQPLSIFKFIVVADLILHKRFG